VPAPLPTFHVSDHFNPFKHLDYHQLICRAASMNVQTGLQCTESFMRTSAHLRRVIRVRLAPSQDRRLKVAAELARRAEHARVGE